MNRTVLDDVELEYELHGDGEPVLLIHPGIFADWFTPLLILGKKGHGGESPAQYRSGGCAGTGS